MVRVWDVPTRVFHWALAAAFAGEWLTRDARYLDVHEFLGYVIAALVAFRLFWGLAGTRWARFASFPPDVGAAWHYLRSLTRGRPDRHVGHNPAGSWAIYALLVLALLQVATGVVALGAQKRLGPLAGLLSYRAGDVAYGAHEWLAYAMLAVVAVHILGVVAGSFLERENLVRSMVTGSKEAPAAAAVSARRVVAAGMIAVLVLGTVAWFRGLPARLVRPGPALSLAMDKRWQSECGSCHLAYHPSLLPALSWDRIFRTQHEHFGEDLDLSSETVEALGTFARAHAAQAHESPAAWQVSRSLAPGAQPLRITDTPYWRARHARLDPSTWQRVRRSECGVCHRDAEAGIFSPAQIDITEAATAAQRKGN